mgnify:CR=1 FL=1
MKVGRGRGGADILTTGYTYDTYGNPVQYTSTQSGQGRPIGVFTYDDQNRVTSGYGESFAWEGRGVLDGHNGADVGYSGSGPLHGIDTVGGVDREDYDLNGGMTVRGKGLSSQQTLRWDSHARLAQVTGVGVSESYLYDVGGQRIRKTTGAVSTFYPFADYEQTGGGVVTKHYIWRGGGGRAQRQRHLLLPLPGWSQQHRLHHRRRRQHHLHP